MIDSYIAVHCSWSWRQSCRLCSTVSELSLTVLFTVPGVKGSLVGCVLLHLRAVFAQCCSLFLESCRLCASPSSGCVHRGKLLRCKSAVTLRRARDGQNRERLCASIYDLGSNGFLDDEQYSIGFRNMNNFQNVYYTLI